MQGHVDQVSSDGLIEGWCWNEGSTVERMTVVIKVDGVEVGRAVAGQYRDDLRAAGIGDGHHAFRFLLPDAILARNRTLTVTLADAATNEPIGEACTLNTEQSLTFDDRLDALEARNRLLEGRVAALTRERGSDGGQAELFAVVGAFFERLSRDLARGAAPTSEQQLGEVLRAMTRTFPPLTFPTTEDPVVSILVEAACPLERVHACLAAIRRADPEGRVRMTVLDTGAFDEVALLPSLVRGIRYVRTVADLVPEWIEAGRGDEAPILLFLSGQAVMGEAFLSGITGWFASHPGCGASGGCVVGQDGTPRQAGLRLSDGWLEDTAGVASSGPAAEGHPVHALPHCAAAFRRAAVQAVGGLDPAFGNSLGAAIIDLCFRLRDVGWSVASLHRATVSLPPGLEKPIAAPDRSPTGDLLRQRWLSRPAQAHPSLETAP